MKKLIRFFNYGVAIAPFLTTVILAIMYIYGCWKRWDPSRDVDHYFLPTIKQPLLVLILCLVFVCILSSLIKYFVKVKKGSLALIILLVVALALRILLVTKKTYKPFSDFDRVWQMAHGQYEGNIEYYTLFPAYLNYMVLLRKVLTIFGDDIRIILIGNAILSTCIIVTIYMIAYLCTKDKFMPLMAALLYAFMPSSIIYCCVITPEFISIFFNCLAVIFSLYSLKQEGWKNILLLFLSGMSIGLSSSYKSFGIVIIVAFSICSVAHKIIQKHKVKEILCILLGIIIMLGGYRITKMIILRNTEREVGIQLDESTAIPHFLLVGLNTEGEGQIHIGTLSRKYYQYYLENGRDSEKAKNYAYDLLKADWRENAGSLPKLFFDKMIWVWQDDVIPVNYYNSAQERDALTPLYFIGFPVATITQTFYLLLMSLGTIGVVYINRRRTEPSQLFLTLIIFGFFCLMLLSEAQSRYKCLVMPFICVISAYGWKECITQLGNVGRKANNFFKKHRLDILSS